MGFHKKIEDDSLVDQLVDKLRDSIIGGKLEPGSHIGIKKIADTYGVSMIPVREALARLIASRLVRMENNRGYFVAERPTPEEFRQFIEARELFEISTIGLGFENAAVGDIKRLRSLNARMRSIAQSNRPDKLVKWSKLNSELHQTLVGLAGNAFLVNQYIDLSYSNMHAQLVQSLQQEFDELQRLVLEHDQLIDALEAGERKIFFDLLSLHIRNAIREN